MRPSVVLWGAMWALAGSCGPVTFVDEDASLLNAATTDAPLQSRPGAWPAYAVRDIGKVPVEFQERRAMPWTYAYPEYATQSLVFATASEP